MSPFVYVQLIFMWIYFVQDNVTCNTEVLNERLTWLQSKRRCDLAKPSFTKTTTGVLKIQDTVNVSNNTWVGYFKATTCFEYKACIPKTGLDGMELRQRTVGLCYKACKWAPIFGMRKTNCYCVDKGVYDEDMSYASPVDCISIYKVNKQVVIVDTEDISNDMCLRFQSSENYKLTDCHPLTRLFCDKDNFPQSESQNNWEDNSKKCFNKSSHALTYNELNTINKTFNNYLWTSITCSTVIYEEKDYDDSLPNIRVGYLKQQSNGTIVLKFENINEKTQRGSLCTKGLSTKSETVPYKSTTFVQSSSNPTPIDQQSTEDKDTVTTFVTTKHAQSHENYKKSDNHKDDSGTFAIVGTLIGIAVVIIATVVAVVISNTRRTTKSQLSGIEQNVVLSNSKSGGIKNEVAAEHKSDPNDISCYSQTYCAWEQQDTEPVKEDSAYDKTKAGDMNLHDTTKAGNIDVYDTTKAGNIDVYDTTKAGDICGKNESDNVYNRLGEDETYDNANNGNVTDKLDRNNTYGKLNVEINTTYDIAGIEKEAEFGDGNIYNNTSKDLETTCDSGCSK